MSEIKSLAQMMRDAKGEPLGCCNQCGHTEGVYKWPEGYEYCPSCGGGVTKTQTILREGEKEAITIAAEEQTASQQVRDCLREDQQRGTPGGGSSSGPSRKKPVKRRKQRHEQDAPIGRPVGDKKKTVRVCKMLRREITISEECYERLLKEQVAQRSWDGTKPPIITLIRNFLTGKKMDIPIERIPRGKPRKELQEMLTPNELALMTTIKDDYKEQGLVLSWGDIIEAGVWEYFPRPEKG